MSEHSPQLAARPLALAKAIRPWQWLKNLLVFLPIISAHRLSDSAAVFVSMKAFAALSLAASAGYLANDLKDRAADRAHPTKRHRPLASGAISPQLACVVAAILILGAALLSASLPIAFQLLLVGYLATSLAYSWFLKRAPGLDAVLLAGFYTVRIVAGGVATGITLSVWLLAFSSFFFLSLALAKRYSEIALSSPDSSADIPGRGYHPKDLDAVGTLGCSSGMISVLVLALYIHAPETRTLYAHPNALWGVTAAMLYWVIRLWLLVYRRTVADDLVLHSARDPVTYMVVAVMAVTLMIAKG